MELTKDLIGRLVDVSAVRTQSNIEEVEESVKVAKLYNFICVYVLPSFIPYAKELLKGVSDTSLGGTVGFPSGASTTATKAFEAKELMDMGCKELDMVMNVGKLKSKLYEEVASDIKKIVEVSGSIPVKVILEVALLTDSEIIEGSKIIYDCGANFIKTGTGWTGETTFNHIELIKKTVGDSIKLKVAGGVRTLDTFSKMVDMGVSRFGLNYKSATNIMNEFLKY